MLKNNMEKNILTELKMNTREEAVAFLKSMIVAEPQTCPLCGGQLDFFHKKAKKNNCDWICTGCGKRYDVIKILNRLNEQ